MSREGNDRRPKEPVPPDFERVDGKILQIVEQAKKNPERDYLLVLDEFNRANVPKILGELLLTLEQSKRATWQGSYEEGEGRGEWKEKVTATLTYSGRDFFVPDNLYVLATMNTTDRSSAPLDAAIRRRFAFRRLEPMKHDGLKCVIEGKIKHAECLKTVVEDIEQWEKLNEVLGEAIGPDGKLGHSYFLNPPDVDEGTPDAAAKIEDWRIRTWRYHVLPQLIDILAAAAAEDLMDEAKAKAYLQAVQVEDADSRARELGNVRKRLATLKLEIKVEGKNLGRQLTVEVNSG